MKHSGAHSRATAAQALQQVLEQQRSLSQVLPSLSAALNARDRSWCQNVCFGVLRLLPQLNEVLQSLLSKPLSKDLQVLHYLLLVGVYQLLFMRTQDHAAVAATVEAAVLLKKGRQKALVNAVLRTMQRQREDWFARWQQQPPHNHPRWLFERIVAAYPDDWQRIITHNNSAPPMWLRVNAQHHDSTGYRRLLDAAAIAQVPEAPLAQAIQLQHAVDVQQLPGFAEGWVSVQDIAAQHAAWLLDPQPGERILDCCAAPGGKTAHLLERQPQLQLLALDHDAQRLTRVVDNLQRLQLHAEVRCADASQPDSWWDGQTFDRILLDAPCSATGVIRRHPDIKWLRRASDIAALVALQQQILRALWSTLKPGGRLLYATCSVLPEENRQQIEAFVAAHPDARWCPIARPDGATEGADWQWLPGDFDGDGFYYAMLEKRT